MLKNIFRPKWQHEDINTRLEAIKALKASDQDTLITIAQNDNSAKARHLALSMINTPDTLLELHEKASADDKHEILLCWARLLADSEQINEHQAEQTILDCKDNAQLTAIISACTNQNLVNLALTGIRDETTALELIQNSKQARLWQQLIPILKSERTLKQALQHIAGSDKKSTQLIKHQLKSIKSEQEAANAIHAEYQHLKEKLTHLIQIPDDPLFEGTLINCEKHYQNVCNALPEEQQHSLHSLFEECRTILQTSQAQAKLAEEAEAESIVVNPKTEIDPAQDLRHQIIQAPTSSDLPALLEKHSLDENTKAEYQALITQLTALDSLNKKLSPLLEKQTLTEALKLKENCISLFQQAKEYKGLKNSPIFRQLESYYSELKSLEKAQNKASHENKQKIDELVQQADLDIENGDLKSASGKLSKIRNLEKSLNARDSKNTHHKILRIQLACKEMTDWQDFATDPKREALCKSMEALISTDLSPENKATAIKQLQDEWKTLGYCHHQHLWEEFQRLSDIAYEPCKQWKDAKHDQQTFNAQQKQIICEQLEALAADNQVNNFNPKALDKLYRETNKQWKTFSPVSPKDHRRLQQRYTEALAPIKEQLKKIKEENAAQLNKLVSEAEALINTDDKDAAIKSFLALKEKWSQVGITFASDQKAAWNNFNEAGNTLFSAQRAIKQEQDASQQDNAKQAEAIIQEIKTKTRECLDAGNSASIDQLKTQFKQNMPLPKNAARKIQQDFDQACKHHQQALKTIKQQKQIEALFDMLDTYSANPNNTIDNNTDIPADIQKALQQRESNDFNQDQAKNICIRMELLAGLESPADEQAQRMQIQVNALQKHFKESSSENRLKTTEDLIIEWLKQPFDDSHKNFEERIRACLEQFKTGAG